MGGGECGQPCASSRGPGCPSQDFQAQIPGQGMDVASGDLRLVLPIDMGRGSGAGKVLKGLG